VGIGVIALKGKNDGSDLAGQYPSSVIVLGGAHPLADGGTVQLSAFTISGHEVTIAEYADFLSALASLPQERRGTYDSPDQPATKYGHEPENWTGMYSAAKAGGQWEGRAMSKDCPVVNVDWWDAVAYCNWKRCRLPEQEEWFAALRQNLPDPKSLRAAGWGSVRQIPPTDRTPSGLNGMAGSVSEWTASNAINPANPLGDKGWVIMGGSFLSASSGALAREWVESRDLRRADLGFRVIEP
jgi:formylglycine-generating enzyme required for sulfatase activity